MLTVAEVLKSNGTDGEIILGFRDIAPEDIDLQEPVFIEFDGLPVPFFIESFVKRGSSRALVRLTGVKNLRDADELAGKLVAVDYFADEEDGEDFIGWTIFNQDGEQIGEVVDYEDIPGNLCLVVDTKEGQALLPFHEDLVLSLDEASKTLTMEVPSGLLHL